MREEKESSPDDLHTTDFTLRFGSRVKMARPGPDKGDDDVFVRGELPRAIGPRH